MACPDRPVADSPGTLHHVIVRGIEKRDIVNDTYDRKRTVTRLGDLAEETKTSVTTVYWDKMNLSIVSCVKRIRIQPDKFQ